VGAENTRNRYDVLEAGVGEGAFALGFLQELRVLDRDKKTDLAARVHYTLADFSKEMIKKPVRVLSPAVSALKFILLNGMPATLLSALSDFPPFSISAATSSSRICRPMRSLQKDGEIFSVPF